MGRENSKNGNDFYRSQIDAYVSLFLFRLNSTVQCIIFPIQLKYVFGWAADATSPTADQRSMLKD